MRVIAGQFRGRTLSAPPGTDTRPITDRVKETLFNILGHRYAMPGEIPDVAVLDVFAGTGSLGIEALSRGARRAIFVERDRRALRALRDNLRQLGLEQRTSVSTDNAWTLRPPPCDPGYGLIFADPPYAETSEPLRVIDLLERLGTGLAPDGVVVYRYEVGRPFEPGLLRTLRVVDRREIGRMRLVLLARADAPASPARAEEETPDARAAGDGGDAASGTLG